MVFCCGVVRGSACYIFFMQHVKHVFLMYDLIKVNVILGLAVVTRDVASRNCLFIDQLRA